LVSVRRNKRLLELPKFNNFRQPKLQQTHVGGSCFLSIDGLVYQNCVCTLKMKQAFCRHIYKVKTVSFDHHNDICFQCTNCSLKFGFLKASPPQIPIFLGSAVAVAE
jgi:hypothetical protein